MPDQAREVLTQEIDSAIEQLQSTTGATGCKAHGSLVFSQIVMLRCERARLQHPERAIAVSPPPRSGISRKEAITWSAAIGTTIAVILKYLGITPP